MKLLRLFAFFAVAYFIFTPIIAKAETYEERVYYSPYLSESEKEQLYPYLLPEDHPLADSLDRIFAERNPMESQDQFVKAGFIVLKNDTRSLIGSHLSLPEYVVKGKRNGKLRNHSTLFNRLENRAAIQWWLDEHQPQYIVVADKYAYPLPTYASMSQNQIGLTHGFVILATKLNIRSDVTTQALFKKPGSFCEEMIKELYEFSRDNQYADAAFRNIRFTTDMKIAIVDFDCKIKDQNELEIFFLENLPPKWRTYWKKLKSEN